MNSRKKPVNEATGTDETVMRWIPDLARLVLCLVFIIACNWQTHEYQRHKVSVGSSTSASSSLSSLRITLATVDSTIRTMMDHALNVDESLKGAVERTRLEMWKDLIKEATKAFFQSARDVEKIVKVSFLVEMLKEADRIPVQRVAPGMMQQQQVQQQPTEKYNYDDEYPSEPVDEHPGPAYVPPPDPLATSGSPEAQNLLRKQAIVEAFQHSWQGYKKHAFGMDELRPRSKSGKNWNDLDGKENGMGLTILDSLSTMHLMGLQKELEDALRFIRYEVSFDKDIDASVFESTIRGLGSLLSIYELTGEKHHWLLDKAVDLADRLFVAYNTSTAIPHSTVNLKWKRHSNPQWSGGSSVLSEFGTVQLELRTLSYHTKNPIYDMKATHAHTVIQARAPLDMLCPVFMSVSSTQWTTDHISLGALGDSFYEYVLKQYLLTGKTEEKYRGMFLRMAEGIVDKLLFYSSQSKLAYVAEYRRREFYHKMDHLACFTGGMLALGANTVHGFEKEEVMKIAAELTETCVKMYTSQKSGVSPEYVEFPGGGDFLNGAGYYILRPETMEPLFYMWRFTKEQKWRDYGWRIFRAINRFCRVEEGGYAGIREVNVKEPIKDNLMQSFWMAETLKYTFLLFAEEDVLNLEEWVLNTEAHPLKVRERDPLDVWREYEGHHGGKVPWYPPPLKDVTPVETVKMRELRMRKGSPWKFIHDPLSEDMEGAIDDEGMPFDPELGLKGVPRADSPRKGRPEIVKGIHSRKSIHANKNHLPKSKKE